MIKKHKRILAATIIGVITAGVATATPLAIIEVENGKKKKNNKDLLVKATEELAKKGSNERNLLLSSDSSGKIIEKNTKKIKDKIQEILKAASIKDVEIDISINQDVDISTIPQSIKIVFKKGDQKTDKINNFKVARKLTLVEKQDVIIGKLDTSESKKIIIEKGATNKIELKEKILNGLASLELTDEEKAAISIKTVINTLGLNNWKSDQEKDVTIAIQFDSETEKTVLLKVTIKKSLADDVIRVYKEISSAKVFSLYNAVGTEGSTGTAAEKNEVGKEALILAIQEHYKETKNLTEQQTSLIGLKDKTGGDTYVAPTSTASNYIVLVKGDSEELEIQVSIKTLSAANTSIIKVKKILNSKTTAEKIITIIHVSTTLKAGDATAAPLIKAKLEDLVGAGKLDSVVITPKSNPDSVISAVAVGFDIELTKTSGTSVTISGYKVKLVAA